MMDKDKLSKSTTTSGKPPEPGMENAGAPEGINEKTGQHKSYWVLTEEERGKGFIRPVRTSYVHKGVRPKHPLRDLTDEEKENNAGTDYAKYEEYPKSERPALGRFWTEEQLNSGCGTITSMSKAIAETYAREPGYYGSTFCTSCGKHIAVEEFVWEGTDEVVGS